MTLIAPLRTQRGDARLLAWIRGRRPRSESRVARIVGPPPAVLCKLIPCDAHRAACSSNHTQSSYLVLGPHPPQQALAQIEALRATLGDAAVDAAIAALIGGEAPQPERLLAWWDALQ